MAGLVGVGLVVSAVNWLLANWWILVALGVAAAGAGIVWLYQRQQRARWDAAQAQALRYAMPPLEVFHHARPAVRLAARRRPRPPTQLRVAEPVQGSGVLGAHELTAGGRPQPCRAEYVGRAARTPR
ncbi:hypothetical protein [Streptomyces sp. NPDC003006]